MKILITGATGLIGNKLGHYLNSKGHDIVVLSRDRLTAKSMLSFPATIFSYNESIPKECLKDVEIIFNFAGASIGEKRWTMKRKTEIYNSRVLFTRSLVQLINNEIDKSESKIKKLISVSAVGYYGDRADESLNEASSPGMDLLARVCIDWENETKNLNSTVDVINPRLGVVLDQQGGALEKLIPLFANGIGSPIGDGHQWMSWIHIDDLILMFEHLMTSKITGAVNAVAPNPVTNTNFSLILAEAFSKKVIFPNVPTFVIKGVLGEMSALVTSSQNVNSKKIQNDGFKFKYEYLNTALNQISNNLVLKHEKLIFMQWIPKKNYEIFKFFSDENNLETITPDFFHLKVLNKSTDQIQENTIINYNMIIYGIPFKWKSKISNWKPPVEFVDTQLSGPYKSLHHRHQLIEYGNGTLLVDTVTYKLPLGIVGRLILGAKVKSDVLKIFKYRREKIAKLFY